MCVLVEDAAKSVVSSDAEPGYLVWIGDRCGQWVQRPGVVEVLEFVQCVQQVSLVPDQCAVQQFVARSRRLRRGDRAAAGPDNPRREATEAPSRILDKKSCVKDP